MSKGLPRSTGRGSPATQEIIKKVIEFSIPIVSSGATGVGFGTAPLAGLPEGNILVLGAVAYATISKNTTLGAAGTLDTFSGNYGIGSAANADADLSDTGDADVIPSTAVGPAVSGVSPVTRGANATPVVIDNTDLSKVLNFNLLLADASVSADTQHLTAVGQVYIAYIVLGDD